MKIRITSLYSVLISTLQVVIAQVALADGENHVGDANFELLTGYGAAATAQGVYFDDLNLCALEDGDDGGADCKEFIDADS